MTAGAPAIKDGTIICRLHCEKLDVLIPLPNLSEIFAKLESPYIIGANAARKESERFSYWVASPRDIFEFGSGEKNVFEKLESILKKYKPQEPTTSKLPEGIFRGGWMGYFSYDLGRHIERVPNTTTDDLNMPLIRLCFYDRVICYDHHQECFFLIVLQLPNDDSVDRKLDFLKGLIDKARTIQLSPWPAVDMSNIDLESMHCNMDQKYYMETVEKIRRYIYDGEVYQINFSQRFDCAYNASAVDLFHWQNQYNPSGYAAYIGADDFQIVSASPEMFVNITDGTISTRPIKGTRPRLTGSKDAQITNEKNFRALRDSEKEQAELNMIVDLERNDLARICQAGSRGVVQQRTIESYPTVFHAMATVAGRIRDDVSFCDVIKAVFPGGSITGAPKIRSMEIIDETEPTARGVYTGSIGYISLDGTVSLNIAIRTIIIRSKRAYVQTGGGIVADSDPQAEWDETITKARALLAGIKAVQ
jgi:para-aminobenzoate synthetase component 1